MAKQTKIKIYHEETNLIGQCLPSALGAWQANGWTVVDDGDSDVEDVVVTEVEQAVEFRLSSEVEEN